MHGIYPLLGNEEGNISMSQGRGEVWNPTARGTPHPDNENKTRTKNQLTYRPSYMAKRKVLDSKPFEICLFGIKVF